MLSQHQEKYVKKLLSIYHKNNVQKDIRKKMIIKLKSKGIIGIDSVCS